MEGIPFDPEKRRFRYAAESAASELHPMVNEDAVLAMPEERVFGVLDGMGGRSAGEVASRLGRDFLMDNLKGFDFSAHRGEDVEYLLAHLLRNADQLVKDKGNEVPELESMGATASVVAFRTDPEGATEAVIANVGDSRIYLVDSRAIRPLTIDDNYIRHITEGDEEHAKDMQAYYSNLADGEDAAADPNWPKVRKGGLLQFLGNGKVHPRTSRQNVLKGDRILILSDGISDNLTDEEIKRIAQEGPSPEEAGRALIAGAQARSRSSHFRKKSDDMTAVVIEVG
jgi:PPM family protein phosphatase